MKIQRSKIPMIILVAVVCFNMLLTLSICVRIAEDENGTNATGYTLYVGLNDKNTYKQEITDEDAMETVEKICTEHASGVTVQTAKGAWTDENGEVTNENTIICYFEGCDRETVETVADELIKELNQNCILIKTNTEITEYYSGN